MTIEPARHQHGFTLLEVLVAAVLLASVMLIVASSIQTATRSAEISQQRSDEIRGLDRVWVLIENDLRNVVAQVKKAPFAPVIPAMKIDEGGEYALAFLRAGQANPLYLPRSEVLRVAYRLDDEQRLWRDSWIDPSRPDEDLARTQQLLEEVEEFTVKALPRPPAGRSITQGPWIDNWPENPQQAGVMPLALEIVMTTKKMGELKRFITLAPGVL